MSLREFLLYPPFFIFASLALAIVLAFLFFIVHQRRGIKKLRQGIKGAALPVLPEKLVSPEEQPVAIPNVIAAQPPAEAPTVLSQEPSLTLEVPSPAAPEAALPGMSLRHEEPAESIHEPVPLSEQVLDAAISTAHPVQPVAEGQLEPQPVQTSKPAIPAFLTFDRKPALAADLLRASLILGAFIITLALSLVLLPQSTFEGMADSIRYRNSSQPQQERLAFLYLGDEVKGTELHIRGAVRNISAHPIEQLDATIRLYAPDRTLLETAVVRMDWEEIAPNATATFHLSYADYHGQFGSYSVDFKLRQGEPVPYKDVRSVVPSVN